MLEYVDGVRLTVSPTSTVFRSTRRLELFLQVAHAVAHAHANLVVHRDLKPSNILAGADGQIKLLDFGVAKLIEQETRRADDDDDRRRQRAHARMCGARAGTRRAG